MLAERLYEIITKIFSGPWNQSSPTEAAKPPANLPVLLSAITYQSEAAFPSHVEGRVEHGLTTLDYMAAEALPVVYSRAAENADDIADEAYRVAKAMVRKSVSIAYEALERTYNVQSQDSYGAWRFHSSSTSIFEQAQLIMVQLTRHSNHMPLRIVNGVGDVMVTCEKDMPFTPMPLKSVKIPIVVSVSGGVVTGVCAPEGKCAVTIFDFDNALDKAAAEAEYAEAIRGLVALNAIPTAEQAGKAL